MFALFEHAKIQPCLRTQGIVKLQCTPYVVAEASHGLRLLLVAFVRAPTDQPAPDLMAILLKLPLDVVCIVESCFAIWRTLGRVPHSMDTMTNMLFEVMRVLVEEMTLVADGQGCSKRVTPGAADLRDILKPQLR